MRKKKITAISFLFLCTFASSGLQASAPAECTTRERIWHESVESIPPGLGDQQVRKAITDALQGPDAAVAEAKSRSGWDWRYEYQDDDAIYAGLTVRSHYLRVAIMPGTEAVRSIVCDSRNLDQSRWSIHRNVPIWKAVLDDNIRIAVRRVAETYESPSAESPDERARMLRKHLDALFESGILSEEEYDQLTQRVSGN